MSVTDLKNFSKPCTGRAIMFAVLFGAFILAYFPILKSLVFSWGSSEEYSHGFFIVPIAAYVVWNKRSILSAIPINPSKWGLAFTLFSLALYIFSILAGILTLASFTMVFALSGMILYFFGLRVFKELFFPLFVLLFMIPIPEQMYSAATIPLQLFVSKISVWTASLLGVPIYREGNVIHLPERALQVVQACSGLRSMISLLTLSLIFGYLTMKSNILRTILFFSGIPIAIFVNIIRVLLMVLIFYYFNFDLTVGTIHTIFGLAIFFLALLILYLLRGALSAWEK
jgi:exosortase